MDAIHQRSISEKRKLQIWSDSESLVFLIKQKQNEEPFNISWISSQQIRLLETVFCFLFAIEFCQGTASVLQHSTITLTYIQYKITTQI